MEQEDILHNLAEEYGEVSDLLSYAIQYHDDVLHAIELGGYNIVDVVNIDNLNVD